MTNEQLADRIANLAAEEYEHEEISDKFVRDILELLDSQPVTPEDCVVIPKIDFDTIKDALKNRVERLEILASSVNDIYGLVSRLEEK